MKKVLLFSLIIGFALSTIAQNGMVSKRDQKRVQEGQEVAVERTAPVPMPELKQGDAVNEDMTRIMVGMAGHQRGLRREEAHVVSYNYEMDVIGVTSILDPETYDFVDELGIVGMWYSADKGQTWSGPVVINDNLSQGLNYYLSGALFNPEDNTTVENMFGVHQGTLVPTSGDWRFKAFGSSSLGGDYLSTSLFEETGDDGYFNIFGLGQYGNEMRALHLKTLGPWSNFTDAIFQPMTGEFDGEGFVWDDSNLFDPELFKGTDGVVAWIGMYVSYDAGTEIAWSNDGQIGYMWLVGVSNEDASGYQPVVFKTEDAGESWDYIYLDLYDSDIVEIYEPYVIESSSGQMIPRIFESAGVVDAHGDLQMMVAMGAHSADVFAYPDSLGWAWTYPGDLFNIVVDEDGISDFMWVDSLRTESVPQDDPGAYCGTEGWQHRISAARSQNGKQVFFTWLDTRDINETLNIKPDLFGWSKSVYGNMMESTVCFSEGTDLEEEFYFNSGSDKAYYNMDEGTYIIPYVQGVTALEFLINTSTSEDPITFSYVTGVEFPDLVTGVREFESANGINVSQNMPNPFTGFTTIEVITETAALVTVEVNNIMGQSIYTIDAGIINGTQEIELSAKGLDAGIYLYTVSIGNESVTKKMIVE